MNHDRLLFKCVSTDTVYKPKMCNPSIIGDSVYATDGHALIKIDRSVLKHDYKEVEKFPRANEVIDAIERISPSFIIKHKELKNLMDGIKKQPYFQECTACEGEGTIECECCGHFTDCEECHGKGDTGKIGGYEYDCMIDRVKIKEGYFNPRYISLLLEASLIENKDIEILSLSSNRAMLSKIGKIEFLIMPMMTDSETDINIHELNIPC